MIINEKEMYECISNLTIATLGPKGTSSEFVAMELANQIGIKEENISLFSSYEEAVTSVKKRKNNILLVANAYKDIHDIYMENDISLIGSFIKETPLYGIASKRLQRDDFLAEKSVQIASHHAPLSMIDVIKKDFDLNVDIVDCMSTSEAAYFVSTDKYRYCLTNEKAQKEYDLEFIMPIKQITMVWSIFGESNYIATFDLLNKLDRFK